MNVLQTIFDRTLSVLLMTFTYLIPLLSSIRAVHHKDLQAYQQWLTYFLLIFLFHPICVILRIHKLIRLVIVLYLSLPKFQGALFVYQEVIHVLLERYAVERKVDEHLDKFKTSIKARLWNIAKDIGWSTLTQVGELVSFVKDVVGNKEDLNMTAQMGDSVKKHNRHAGESFVATSIKRNPSHSVLESWSSFCSQEGGGSDQSNCNLNDIPIHEREAYVQDFLAMLREGLYVFAAQIMTPTTTTTTGGTMDEKDERMDNCKKFRLRVFFYQDSINYYHHGTKLASHEKHYSDGGNRKDDSNDKSSSNRCFVFQSVEHNTNHSHPNQEDMEIISMDDIHEIRRTSANGIEFLSLSSSNIMIDAGGLPTNPIVEKFLAEIVLSSHDDRETLFMGLDACLSWFRSDEQQQGKEERIDDFLDVDLCSSSSSSSSNGSDSMKVQTMMVEKEKVDKMEEIQPNDSHLQDLFVDNDDDTSNNYADSNEEDSNDMKVEEQRQSPVDLLEEMNHDGIGDLGGSQDSKQDKNKNDEM